MRANEFLPREGNEALYMLEENALMAIAEIAAFRAETMGETPKIAAQNAVFSILEGAGRAGHFGAIAYVALKMDGLLAAPTREI
jgi:pantothenate synthetase